MSLEMLRCLRAPLLSVSAFLVAVCVLAGCSQPVPKEDSEEGLAQTSPKRDPTLEATWDGRDRLRVSFSEVPEGELLYPMVAWGYADMGLYRWRDSRVEDFPGVNQIVLGTNFVFSRHRNAALSPKDIESGAWAEIVCRAFISFLAIKDDRTCGILELIPHTIRGGRGKYTYVLKYPERSREEGFPEDWRAELSPRFFYLLRVPYVMSRHLPERVIRKEMEFEIPPSGETVVLHTPITYRPRGSDLGTDETVIDEVVSASGNPVRVRRFVVSELFEYYWRRKSGEKP